MGIKKMINDYYKGLAKFYDDEAVNQLLIEVQNKVLNIYLLSQELICFSSVIKEKEISYSIFNKKIISKLLEFCFLSIVREHIVLVDQIVVKIVKEPSEISDIITSAEVESAVTGELIDELEIVSGEVLFLSEKISDYLVEILSIFINTKSSINYSYEDIK